MVVALKSVLLLLVSTLIPQGIAVDAKGYNEQGIELSMDATQSLWGQYQNEIIKLERAHEMNSSRMLEELRRKFAIIMSAVSSRVNNLRTVKVTAAYVRDVRLKSLYRLAE